jgi:hypothetical protein
MIQLESILISIPKRLPIRHDVLMASSFQIPAETIGMQYIKHDQERAMTSVGKKIIIPRRPECTCPAILEYPGSSSL